MYYDEQLSFVQTLLSGMQIPSHIATNPDQSISREIDRGLRAMLYGMDSYQSILHNSMSSARSNTIYRFYDEYFCRYIFMKLPDDNANSYFFIGPYLLSPISEDALHNRFYSYNFSEDLLNQINRYYTTLPIVEDENLLLIIANTLGKVLWGSPDNFETEYVDYEIPDGNNPIPYNRSAYNTEIPPFSLDIIEQNYACEKAMMEAVSQGKLHKLSAITAAVFNNGTRQRVADSLRNRKNYLIILKTLLRKAAEYGGVHPFHIDRISNYYAKQIEAVRSLNESLTLQSEMMREYCLLVKNHSLKNYSPLIGKVITLIQYDLQADLTLKTLSTRLNVSATHLSAQFKKECGCTLTEFVNRKRIDKAKSLLQTSNRLVQDIAFECGINDVNYFIRLFKKYTGITPAQFR